LQFVNKKIQHLARASEKGAALSDACATGQREERARHTHNYVPPLRKLERNANNNGIRAAIRGFFLYIQQGGAAARETSF